MVAGEAEGQDGDGAGCRRGCHQGGEGAFGGGAGGEDVVDEKDVLSGERIGSGLDATTLTELGKDGGGTEGVDAEDVELAAVAGETGLRAVGAEGAKGVADGDAGDVGDSTGYLAALVVAALHSAAPVQRNGNKQVDAVEERVGDEFAGEHRPEFAGHARTAVILGTADECSERTAGVVVEPRGATVDGSNTRQARKHARVRIAVRHGARQRGEATEADMRLAPHEGASADLADLRKDCR